MFTLFCIMTFDKQPIYIFIDLGLLFIIDLLAHSIMAVSSVTSLVSDFLKYFSLTIWLRVQV